jgi:hypothetical protein
VGTAHHFALSRLEWWAVPTLRDSARQIDSLCAIPIALTIFPMPFAKRRINSSNARWPGSGDACVALFQPAQGEASLAPTGFGRVENADVTCMMSR